MCSYCGDASFLINLPLTRVICYIVTYKLEIVKDFEEMIPWIVVSFILEYAFDIILAILIQNSSSLILNKSKSQETTVQDNTLVDLMDQALIILS